jgi:hypothetical protein
MFKFFVVLKTLAIRLYKGSVTISEKELEFFCPEAHHDGRTKEIVSGAILYRRFQPHHFDANGDLNPAYFEFPKKTDARKSGQSFLLKGIASPFHALHRNCNGGKRLHPGLWEVYRLDAANIPKQLADPTQKTFFFWMIHAPLPTCRAHCELFCSDVPNGRDYVLPGKVVRTTMRIKLSRRFVATGVKAVI